MRNDNKNEADEYPPEHEEKTMIRSSQPKKDMISRQDHHHSLGMGRQTHSTGLKCKYNHRLFTDTVKCVN